MAKTRVKQAWEIQLEHDTATLVALGYDPELSHAVLYDGGERYLIPFIKKYLRTEEQKQWMAAHDISIEDALNGRIEGGTPAEVVAMFEDWKQKTAGLLF